MNIQIRVASAQALKQVQAMNAAMGNLNRTVNRGSGTAQVFGRNVSGIQLARFGNQIQWTGRQLQYNWTLPILLAGGAALKFQLDVERAFTRVRKVYGDASLSVETINNELKALEKNFEALSNRFGVHQAEVVEIAAAWAAAGASGIALAKGVQATLTTMVLGQIEAAKATEALIAIQAQYGLTVEELTAAIATLNVIENQTGISLQGLIDGFARAAGVARNAGVDIRHLGAMLAALTPAAGTASQAGNALKTIISRLLAPTREAAQVMGLMGINVEETGWQSLNAVDRLELMADTFMDLDDAQKAVVSSVIASRYQINKFDQLMRELTSDTGYYQRALDATADQAQALLTAQRELNTVLESSPKRLEQIWVILQNASANIVQPLIPYILYLANAAKELVVGFSELNPVLQKTVIVGLAALAMFGLLIRYVGSIITLFGYFRVTTHLLWIALTQLVVPLAWLVTAPFSALGVAIGALGNAFLFLGGVLGRIPALIFGGIRAMMVIVPMAATSARTLVMVWTAAFAVMRANLVVFTTWVGLAFATMTTSATTRMMVFAKAVPLFFVMMGRNIVAVLSAARATVLLIFGSLALGVKAIMMNLLGFLARLGPLILMALRSPWTIAIGAVIAVVTALGKQIAEAWSGIVDWFREHTEGIVDAIIRAWYALPEGIVGALTAVVNVVREAAMAVAEWLSFLNPFARHSPSLVDSVTRGVAVIIAQYNKATKAFRDSIQAIQRAEERAKVAQFAPGALGSFDAMTGALRNLNSMLATVGAQVTRQRAIVDQWAAALDRANDQLDAANAQLDIMRDRAEVLEDALSEARDRLSSFAEAPIVGMQAMSDAIFENEMAQKALRLEILRLEEATGPIEDVRSQLSALAGDIEMARSEVTSLRRAGAGSDILGPMEEHVADLRAAYEDMQDTISESPVGELQQELERLQRQGEILDLENALKFQPLQRQIEQLVDTSRELTFQEIINGVQQAQADVARYTAQLDQANAAIRDQEAYIKTLETARDAIQETYDAEREKLQQLEDSYSQVESAIRDVEGALRDMTAAADEAAQRARTAAQNLTPGAESFLAAEGGNFPEVGGMGALGREGGIEDQSALIDQMTQDLANETANLFKGLDIFKPIREKWDEVWGWIRKNIGPIVSEIGELFGDIGDVIGDKIGDWKIGEKVRGALETIGEIFSFIWDVIGPPIIEIGKAIVQFFVDLWNEVGPEIAKFADLFKPLWEAIVNVWNIVKPILAVFAAAFIAVGGVVFEVISNVIGPVFDTLVDIIEGAVQFIRGILEVLIGIFTLDFDMIKQGVIDIFSGMWEAVQGIIKGAIGVVWGIIRGFGEGIWNFLKALWERIKGNVQTVWNGLVAYFKFVWSQIQSGVSTAWNAVASFFKSIFDWIKRNAIDPWVNAFNVAKDKLIGVKDKVVETFNNMKDAVGDAFGKLVDNIKSPVRSLFRWINTNLIKNANKVTELFGLTIPSLPVNFNKGGVVPGGGPNRDTVMAGLTPGEGVLTRDATRAIGGARAIDAINKGAMGGPFDIIGDIWEGITGQIGEWLKKGVAFAMEKIMTPIVGGIRDLLPSGFIRDFVSGVMERLKAYVKSWGEKQDKELVAGPSSAVAAKQGWVLPLPRGSYRIGSGLERPGHTGQDLPAARGTPIYAVAAGKVSRALRWTTSYGIHAFIDHLAGYQTRYAHMAEMFVKLGQIVRQGQNIGTVDSTGNSTGNHLHLEVRRNGAVLNPRGVIGLDRGGVLPPGYSTVWNGTGGMEGLIRSADIGDVIAQSLVRAVVVAAGDIKRAWFGGTGAVGGVGGLAYANGRVAGLRSERSYVLPAGTGTGEYREIHFHGDLSFPNVKDGSDAERFLDNLEALARG